MTKLPILSVNCNGDLGVHDWRSDPHNGLSQRLTLEEKREIARRANVYPQLIEVLRFVTDKRTQHLRSREMQAAIHALKDRAMAALRALGEES